MGVTGGTPRWMWSLAASIVLATALYLAIAGVSVSGAVTCSRVADATSGSDLLGDGSSANPWRTAQKLADNLTPGQIGCLRAGTYTEDVTVSHSGTGAQPITIRSFPSQTATIRGKLTVTADNVTISQLVLDAHLASGGYGQVVEGDDVTFTDDNVTSGATASCFKVGNSGTSAARAYRLMITRSRIHNCGTGVRVSAATNTNILYNLIYDNVDRGVRLEPDAYSGTVYRNVIDSNGEGVQFANDSASAPTSNTVHKNVISNSSSRWNIGSSFGTGPAGAYNHVWNNCLFASNVDSSFDGSGGVAPPSPTRGFVVYDSYLATGDPQYADHDAGDFHMGSASPCLPVTGDIAGLLDGSDGAPPDSAVPIRRPNVLFIVTDDQRSADTLASMPKTRKWFQTGYTDSGDIQAGGTYFPRNVSTTPLCCPGRTGIFSGRYAHNTGIEHNCCVEQLFDQDRTIQGYLGPAGYKRGMFGRFMHWNYWLNPPNFDRWSIGSAGSFFAPDVNEQGVRKGASRAPRQYSTDYFRDQTLTFIDEQQQSPSTPWFADMATYAPHLPSNPNTPYDSAHYPASNFPTYQLNPAQQETDLSDKPPYVQTWSDAEDVFGTNPEGTRLKELRALLSVDDAVDALFTKLQQTGELADTLAFFISDNGDMWREHGLTKKSKPYLDSINSPMLMRWPANPKVRRNAVDDRFTSNIDLAPTVMDATGVSPESGHPMDGISLLDRTKQRSRILTEYWGDLTLEEDESTSVSSAVAAASATTPKWHIPPWASITTRDYQYTEYYDDEGTQPTFREFYDLRNDPYELNNLYGGDGDPSNDPPTTPTAASLSAQLLKDRLCRGTECSPGPGASSSVDTSAPTLWLRSPADGDTLNGLVEVKPQTMDNLGVKSVRYQLDNVDIVPIQTGQPWGFDWDTRTVANGQHTLKVTSSDTAGNATTVTEQVTIDNTGIDIQAYNNGATPGFPETDDTVVYSFGTAIDPDSILSGWDGSPTSVYAKFNADDPLHEYNDSFNLQRTSDSSVIAPMGVIDLGHSDYVGLYEPGGIFNATMLMSADHKTITVALGTSTFLSAAPHGTPGTMTWFASALARKAGGAPYCNCQVHEGIPPGTSKDREF